MYNVINLHIEAVLKHIHSVHICDHSWLIQNVQKCADLNFRKLYKKFWKLNAARLSASYCNAYFEALQVARVRAPHLGEIAKQLYESPTHANNRRSLQFSFASKLIHMVNPKSPIHDSRIVRFYFFNEPDRKLSMDTRVEALIIFHDYLTREYSRIIKMKLLATSMQIFNSDLMHIVSQTERSSTL
jgi:hypothetical protein